MDGVGWLNQNHEDEDWSKDFPSTEALLELGNLVRSTRKRLHKLRETLAQ